MVKNYIQTYFFIHYLLIQNICIMFNIWIFSIYYYIGSIYILHIFNFYNIIAIMLYDYIIIFKLLKQ